MSKYYTNFEDSGIGSPSVLTGFSRRWDAITTPANHVTNLRYDTVPVKRRAVEYYQAAVSTFPGAITLDAVDSDANRSNVEILTAVKRRNRGSPDTPATIFWLFARGSGATAGVANAFTAELRFGDANGSPNVVAVRKVVAGAATTLASAAFTFDTTQAYWVRFRVQDQVGSPTQTQLQLRVWADGTAEPSSWNIDIAAFSSALFGAAGWCGFQWYADWGKGGGLVNFFSVATNGDAAFKPKTNAEYTAWLGASAQRCVLFDLTARGYAPGGGVGSPSTFMTTLSFYVSNMGFTSQAWDSPASQHYDAWVTKIPTFSRQMGTALSGEVSTSYGSMTVANPRRVAGGPGVRDDWLRMKWDQSFVKEYLGDPTWAKADFRLVYFGRLGQPTAPSVEKIEFKLLGLVDLLEVPFQTNTFSVGPFAGRCKPIAIGSPQHVDLCVIDPATATYHLSDDALADVVVGTGAALAFHRLYDAGLPLYTFGFATADPATDFFTYTAATPGGAGVNHGALNGWRVQIEYNSTPAGITDQTLYYVVNKTATTFQVSLTRGGAAINFTTAGVGVTALLMAYSIDYTARTVTLESNPTGRVTSNQIVQGPWASNPYIPTSMLEYVLFSKAALPLDYKDQSSFDAMLAASDASAAGIYTSLDNLTVKQVVSQIITGVNAWLEVTPDGRIQVGYVGQPSATSTQTLLESDVRGLVLSETIRPYDFSAGKSSLSYGQPNLFNGPLMYKDAYAGDTQFKPATKMLMPAQVYAGTTPLDARPDLASCSPAREFATIYSNGPSTNAAAILLTLFQKTIGLFEVNTRLSAIERNIGETITLKHSRLGWKEWGGTDPASPDNPTTTDSTKAVILGIDYDLSSTSPFPVKLKLMRPIPGAYPTSAVQ